MRKTSRAFTLIELLVVVAIIVVLISILMPSLNNARNQAKAVKCMSNLKQLGSAAFVYAQEYDGILPIADESKAEINPVTSGSWVTNMWMYRLLPYVNKTMPKNPSGLVWRQNIYSGVLNCPSKYDYNPNINTAVSADNEAANISYAMNSFSFNDEGRLLPNKNGTVNASYYPLYYQKTNNLNPNFLMMSDAHLTGSAAWAVLRNYDYLYNVAFAPTYHSYGHNILFTGGDVQRVPLYGITWYMMRKK